MLQDHWKEEYVNEFVKQVAKIRDLNFDFPKELVMGSQNLVDKSTHNPFGSLRGDHSILKKLFEEYMPLQGVSDRFNLDTQPPCVEWANAVGANSWNSNITRGMKYFWFNQRTVPYTEYWWGKHFHVDDNTESAKKAAFNNCKTEYEDFPLTKWRGISDFENNYKLHWTIWHAFVYVMLESVAFPNNDQNTRTLRVIRMEASDAMKLNSIEYGPNKQMKRGACESASILKMTQIAGSSEITAHVVPYFRIVHIYFFDSFPYNSSKCVFKDEGEFEVGFLPQGVPFEYAQTLPESFVPKQEKNEDKYAALFG